MNPIDEALQIAAQATIHVVSSSPGSFQRPGATDYTTGVAAASSGPWTVIHGPPEGMESSMIARGNMPPASVIGQVRFTVAALDVPDGMGEPRINDRVTLFGESAERAILSVERLGAEYAAAYVVRAGP